MLVPIFSPIKSLKVAGRPVLRKLSKGGAYKYFKNQFVLVDYVTENYIVVGDQ